MRTRSRRARAIASESDDVLNAIGSAGHHEVGGGEQGKEAELAGAGGMFDQATLSRRKGIFSFYT